MLGYTNLLQNSVYSFRSRILTGFEVFLASFDAFCCFFPCTNNPRYRLEPQLDKNDEFVLLDEGYLQIPALSDPPIHPSEYCLESFKMDDGSVAVLPLICFPQPVVEPLWKTITDVIYPLGCIISVPFLIMILFVYLGISELKDTYGKLVSCHCFCLAVAYATLGIVHIFGSDLTQEMCIGFAYIIQFSFLSCFIWLNILCFHTWKRLTRKATHNTTSSSSDKCVFFKYNLFAWGIPTAIVVITVVMDYTPSIPLSYLKPNMGVSACWFQGDKSVIPFFYGPIILVLIGNTVYFVLTARFLHKNRNKKNGTSEIHHLSDVVNAVIINRKEKLFMQVLVLFCMMGLNWILEVLSWAIGSPSQFWIITDVLNTLQGPILFWVFVLNDMRVRQCAKAKYCKCCLPKSETTPEETLMVELPEVIRRV
ncbi:G-protein coupled receptor Mth2-like isoform X2 [Cimex lectularius]|uniref:G-protein coupled receptors family 2 profile 2 domain-containing protein n=1 Tax=Cimex lectularius TaxID=79782 RepID=A0A8I6SFM1_CIMLE|nr:G-protein coupled receptor Mth2-like isoform X2 [Cimex lectularius]